MNQDSTVRAHVIEAVAWWRVGLRDGAPILARCATEALVAGLGGEALTELAGIANDINPFELDALIERVADELDLRTALEGDPAMIAVRRICRVVLADEMSERELTRWVHSRFHHRSDADLLNELAGLDDEYDLIGPEDGRSEKIDAQVRAIAAQVLSGWEAQRRPDTQAD